MRTASDLFASVLAAGVHAVALLCSLRHSIHLLPPRIHVPDAAFEVYSTFLIARSSDAVHFHVKLPGARLFLQDLEKLREWLMGPAIQADALIH